jgi:hypothetical protein
MSTVLLHHADTGHIDEIKSSLKPGLLFSSTPTFTSKPAIDAFFRQNVKKQYSTLGLFYHNPEDGSIPFFKDVSMKDIGGLMEYFFQKCKIHKVSTVDLITCNIKDPTEQSELRRMATDYNLTIRFSINETSDLTDWIMESHDVNVYPIYFTKPIDKTIVLGLSIIGYHYLLSNNNKLCFTGTGNDKNMPDGLYTNTIDLANTLKFTARNNSY